MTSTWLMRALLGAYLVIAGACVVEGQYAKALYWAGAGVITVSLLWM